MKLRPRFAGSLLPLLGAAAVLCPRSAATVPAPDLSVTNVCSIAGYQAVTCLVTITNPSDTPSTSPLVIQETTSGAPANAISSGHGGSLPAPTSCTGTQGASANQPVTCTFKRGDRRSRLEVLLLWVRLRIRRFTHELRHGDAGKRAKAA